MSDYLKIHPQPCQCPLCECERRYIKALSELASATGSAQSSKETVHLWMIGTLETLCGVWMPMEYPKVTLRPTDATYPKCKSALEKIIALNGELNDRR